MAKGSQKFERLVAVIEEMAAGNLHERYPISRDHDEIDALRQLMPTLSEPHPDPTFETIATNGVADLATGGDPQPPWG